MDRRLFKIAMRIVVCLVFSALGFSTRVVATAVIDVSSIAKLGEVLSVSTKMLGTISNVQNELAMVNSVMGNPLSARLMDSLGEHSSQFSEFAGVLDSLTSSPGETLNKFNVDYLGGKDRSDLLFMKDYAQSKLHHLQPKNSNSDNILDVKYESQPLTVYEQQQIIETRQNLLVTASSNGLALSDNQKKMVAKNQKALERLVKKHPGRTMIELALRQIKLLELLVNAMNQNNILLAQNTELLSAQTAQATPIAFRGGGGGKEKSSITSSLKSKLFGG